MDDSDLGMSVLSATKCVSHCQKSELRMKAARISEMCDFLMTNSHSFWRFDKVIMQLNFPHLKKLFMSRIYFSFAQPTSELTESFSMTNMGMFGTISIGDYLELGH
jgi:hypothetical protein